MKQSFRDFYQSPAWLAVRQAVKLKAGSRCVECGQGWRQGAPIEVHHILSPLTHPDLALEESNLRCLCAACHMGYHWLEWGIKQKAANDPTYHVDRKRPRSTNTLQLKLPL